MSNQQVSLNLFLTFNGNAEEALRFYEDVLPGAKIESLTLFAKDAPNGDEGKVLNGFLSFGGQRIMFMDMMSEYPVPPFTYSTSLMVNCVSEAEFDAIFEALAKEGSVMMGPESVEGLRKVAWVTDKFGVTWQPVWA